MWLADGRSVFDVLGFEWSLLVTAESAIDHVDEFQTAAAKIGIGLELVNLSHEDAGPLYGADLLLVRPDQIVAWRGSWVEGGAEPLLRELMGFVTTPKPTADTGADAVR
jgi:hypothetical protein